MKKRNIMVVTGGTGGHIYPALTLADALKSRGHEVAFIGNDHKMEADLVPAAGFKFYGIKNQGLVGNPLQKILILLAQIKPTLKSIKLLKQAQSEMVIGFGGYVSIPVGLAAAYLKLPLYLHEQNAISGTANRILQRFAQQVAVSYPTTINEFKAGKARFIGNPRGALFKPQNDAKGFFGDLNLDPNRFTILIVMGSQGSETINDYLKTMIPLVKDKAYQLIIVSGAKHYHEFMDDLDVPANVKIMEHINQLESLSYINGIVCRGGATTVSEVIAAQIPAIFIPSPYVVKNHQFKNIEPLIDAQAAYYVPEANLDAQVLVAELDRLFEDKLTYQRIKENIKAFQTPSAIDDFIALIDNYD